jgi:pimeloyl-ACP methyl ester carboxylesterase
MANFFTDYFKKLLNKKLRTRSQELASSTESSFEETSISAPLVDAVEVIDNEPETLSLDLHYPPTLPTTHFFEIHSSLALRKIAYTVSGNLDANKILLCLPGLLETKSSFAVLHAYFLRFTECQVISVDFTGRGESDPLTDNDQYRMSVYLADICTFIESVILNKNEQKIRLTLLGTSMGGVLAMYLAQCFKGKIHEIILNDIALTVNWTSLYALYKSMHNEVAYTELRELARELSVHQRVITDVQLPSHFDLPYRADVWGMNFHDVLSNYRGRVGLIYGSDSKICTSRRVNEAKAHIKNLYVCEVPNAGHPAPFNLLVCSFIQDEMAVKG